MQAKGLVHGDVGRATARYSRPNLEWCDDWPPVNDTYDLVVLDHFLQTATRSEVGKLVGYYRDLLKIGGELIIVVPSLEWAAGMIMTEDNPPAMAYMSIYGDDKETFKCGLTLSWLRLLVEATQGLHLESAVGEWYLADVNGKQEKVMQNVVICQRRAVDVAEAIA